MASSLKRLPAAPLWTLTKPLAALNNNRSLLARSADSVTSLNLLNNGVAATCNLVDDYVVSVPKASISLMRFSSQSQEKEENKSVVTTSRALICLAPGRSRTDP